MNKKILYAIIAIIVVVILVAAIIVIIPRGPLTSATITVSVGTTTAIVGQNLTFAAFISGGTPSNVLFNFGDGTTSNATLLSGNEYTVTHSYSSIGKYLVTASAIIDGKTINNMQGIPEVSIIPSSISPVLASEITLPFIITSSQIISPNNTISFTASTSEPPTATNWAIGYYIWNFGDGITYTNSTIFNTSSRSYMLENISHLYSTPGIYVVTLGVITFNATNYVPITYKSDGIEYEYYPISYLASIFSGGHYHNNTYKVTIVVNSTAKLLTGITTTTKSQQITVTPVEPGGSYSFDPAITYDGVDFPIISSVYETLVAYTGTNISTKAKLFPYVASEIPTVANGGISPDYLNYTFHIRSGLKFSNGDSLTAWDVYTSFIRTMLFVTGSPGTPGWIICQDLLPGGGFAPNATSFQNITRAITVDNATQTITFHLLYPDPAFITYLANPFGSSIMDYKWLVAHGAGITFTPSGFEEYQKFGNLGYYNDYIRYNAMGSGPYMVENFIPGQSILLIPNPYYTPVPGVPVYDHKANYTIYIQWIKDPGTAVLMAESGQTDITWLLPTYDYPVMAKLQSEGKMQIEIMPTMDSYYFSFNFNINTTMLSSINKEYYIPQYYFTNLDVRRAFAYAFDYTNYIENILGNRIYGTNFGSHYTGFLISGFEGYLNSTQLQQAGAVVPTYNLTIAKQYMEKSGLYNTSINIPIFVYAGDVVDYAAASMWAKALNYIDPNIHASAAYIQINQLLGYMVPGQNPMPIYLLDWTPDFLFPSANMIPMYQENGFSALANSYNSQLLESLGEINQSKEVTLMNQYLLKAQTIGNETLAIKYYQLAEIIGINLTFYVYLYIPNQIFYLSSSTHNFQLSYPVYSGEILFLALTKS